VKQRPFVFLGLFLLLSTGAACSRTATVERSSPGVIVLGFDGMDYHLTSRMLAEGRLPNLARLAEREGFSALATSVPPQSPVAWSDFITGADAGEHGIFDFIHRDPESMAPYLSTSRSIPSSRLLRLGPWQLPLSSGKVELLRKGRPFWEQLEELGVETTIVRMPANFPPSGIARRELSGMGTPDIVGSYGTFSFFTTDHARFPPSVGGGTINGVEVRDGVVRASLEGPPNPLLVSGEPVRADLTIHVDVVSRAARIRVGNEQVVLSEGEWSTWIPVRFRLAPTQGLDAMCRFYLRSVHPAFELYVTPLNIDPLSPVLPISSPRSFAIELARATGRFYTQGMPEDTSALAAGVLSQEEFLAQARIAGEEVERQYRWLLERYDGGLLFYYFSEADQVSHMVWRSMDPSHPAYDEDSDSPYADVIPQIYQRFDQLVGETMERMPHGTLLVVMSDHGFTSWRRTFNLNSWLRDEGYLAVRDRFARQDPGLFSNVNWTRTRAYGLGMNGLYLNLKGREKDGTVSQEERETLIREIEEKLLALRDSGSGAPVVKAVYRQGHYSGASAATGPDMVIGYADGFRCGSDSAVGAVPRVVLEDNTGQWSGDHCMDPSVVPGILFTSRPLALPASRLSELGAAIVAEFQAVGERTPAESSRR
jgi:predicted AlkP superfamily phosphohydrolase/phosphomutase